MNAEPMTLDADWVVTMAGPRIRKGRLLVETGCIAAVGPASDLPIRGRHYPLGQTVLLPGLINAHCHLELSAYHGALPASDFWSWLPRLVMLRRQRDAAERERAAVGAAVRAMLASGTTCVGDISRADWLPAVLQGQPIRKVCYVELISGAKSPPADMAQLRERLAQLPCDPLLVAGISPHSPYTVTAEDLAACVALARREGLPLAMHLAETIEEVEWLRGGGGSIQLWQAKAFARAPRPPLCGAGELGLRLAGEATSLIHMNYADDWRRLCERTASAGPAVVYCPRAHAFFGHEKHPFEEMLAAGLPVALGTDSAASHPSKTIRPLSILDELRWVAAASQNMSRETLLRMATIHAARALGLSDRIGQISTGYEADLIGVPMRWPDADPLAELLEGQQQPCLVCVAGRVLSLSASDA